MPDNPIVLAPDMIRRPPLWGREDRRLTTAEVWDRLRREPELPMLLKETDLLPTLRAGLTTEPEAKWIYYIQPEKKVFTRDNAAGLSPIIGDDHYLYEPAAAVTNRIVPVVSLSPQDILDHLWPRSGTDREPSVSSTALLSAAMTSDHFPVVPTREVLWRGLQDGGRENRWVLYLRGPNLAIGAAEMGEWPGTPRFDETTELWTYQAALDARIYPREEIVMKAEDRRRFGEGLLALPSEVILYWFTLCFYGYRQAAGRVALRTLLTHQEPEERARRPSVEKQPATSSRQARLAFDEGKARAVREELGRYSSRLLETAAGA